MPDSSPQSFSHHTRYDPLFHFFILPVFVITLIATIVHLVRRPGLHSAWLVVVVIAVLVAVFKIRLYALKVQDRVIRLEERLRLQALAPTEWHSQIYRLTEDQLIGLRFAADDEVVELAKQALEHNWNRKQIKERIQNWRADYLRV
jgi:hypothetical protein